MATQKKKTTRTTKSTRSTRARKPAARKKDPVNGLFGYIGQAFDTGVNAAQEIHQAGVEIPINILQGLGLPEDKANDIKEKHRDLLGSIYGSVQSVVTRVGKAGADQVNLVREQVKD